MSDGYKPRFYIDWSERDEEFIGLCDQYPSLSYLAKSEAEALLGIYELVMEIENEGKPDQKPKLGFAGVIGKWPGDETDEQILKALEENS